MKAQMWHEIHSQAEAWASAVREVSEKRSELERVLESARGREVRFLGAGSSYYLGLAASLSWARGGWLARALASSEQLLHPQAYPSPRPPLTIAVSRSGATTETVKALKALKTSGSPAIAISTEEKNLMAEHADVTLTVSGGKEQATVQTRSFSGQLVAAQALGFLAGGDEAGFESLAALPGLAHSWLERSETVVEPLAQAFERTYLLGSGERWGLALEGALKMKETSLTEAEGFQFLEFRHGPMSMVDERTLVIGLVSETAGDAEVSVLEEMRKLGAQVLALGEDLERRRDSFTTLSFASGLPEHMQLALYLPPLQLLAYHRALSKNLDPDHPRNLKFAIELEHL